jgi:hypothetical protein
MEAFETIVPVGVVHCALAKDSRATGDAFLPAFFALRDLSLGFDDGRQSFEGGGKFC